MLPAFVSGNFPFFTKRFFWKGKKAAYWVLSMVRKMLPIFEDAAKSSVILPLDRANSSMDFPSLLVWELGLHLPVMILFLGSFWVRKRCYFWQIFHDARGSRTLECATFLIHKDEIEKALGKTNCGGKTLLKQALLGHFPAYLREVSRGLSQASNLEEMRKVVIKVGTHGETSGTDASVGLLWFLDLCNKGIGSRD
jgi:hypothetical protein